MIKSKPIRGFFFAFIAFIATIIIAEARDVGIPPAPFYESTQSLATNLKIKLVRIGQINVPAGKFRFNYKKSVEENIKSYFSINELVEYTYDSNLKILWCWTKKNSIRAKSLLDTVLSYNGERIEIKHSLIPNLKIRIIAKRPGNLKIDSSSSTLSLRKLISCRLGGEKYRECEISLTWPSENSECINNFQNLFKDDFKLTKNEIKETESNRNSKSATVHFSNLKPLSFNLAAFLSLLANPSISQSNSEYLIGYYAIFHLTDFIERLTKMHFWREYSEGNVPLNISFDIIDAISKQKKIPAVRFILVGIKELANDNRRFNLIKSLPNTHDYNGVFAKAIEQVTKTNKANWFAYNTTHFKPGKFERRNTNASKVNWESPNKIIIGEKHIAEIKSKVVCYKYTHPFVIGGTPLLKFEPSDLDTPEKAYFSFYSARSYQWESALLYERYPKEFYSQFYSWYSWHSGLSKIVEIKYRIEIDTPGRKFVLFPTTHFITKAQAECEDRENTIFDSNNLLIHTSDGWKIMMSENLHTNRIKKYALKLLRSISNSKTK